MDLFPLVFCAFSSSAAATPQVRRRAASEDAEWKGPPCTPACAGLSVPASSDNACQLPQLAPLSVFIWARTIARVRLKGTWFAPRAEGIMVRVGQGCDLGGYGSLAPGTHSAGRRRARKACATEPATGEVDGMSFRGVWVSGPRNSQRRDEDAKRGG